MDHFDPDLDALLAEAGWLRRFALHLTQDPGAAHDLVQETWVAALRRPSAERIRSPRSWLTRVARRLASGARRSERARSDAALAAREGEPDGALATDELVQRLELQQLVAAAVLGLDDPFRSTLYELYYCGLSAEEVARNAGVTAGTVRWRAFRARQLVRDELERKSRTTWASLALQIAPIGAGGTLKATATAAPMNTKIAIAWGAVGALLAVVTHDIFPEDGQRSDDVVRAVRELELSVRDEAPELTPVPAEQDADLLREREPVVGDLGWTLARGWLRADVGEVNGAVLRFRRGSIERTVEVSGSDYATDALEPGTWDVEIVADGFATHVTTLVVPPDGTVRCDFDLVRTGAIAVRVSDASGGDLSLGTTSSVPLTQQLSVQARTPEGKDAGHWRSRTFLDQLPSLAADALGELVLTAPPPLVLTLTYGDRAVDEVRLDRIVPEYEWRIDPERLTRLERGLQASVDCSSACFVRIYAPRLRGSDPVIIPVEGGELRLRLAPGDYTLEFGAKDHRPLRRDVSVDDSDVDLGTVELERTETAR